MTTPKQQRLSNDEEWPDYFMGVACQSATMSKDPNTKVGACIVNSENKILATGFNCMPTGGEDLPWSRDHRDELKMKYLYVCHAELNAIVNSHTDVKGCTIYVTMFPCNECAKIIIQSGIEKVVYLSDKYSSTKPTIAAKRMLDLAKVPYSQFPRGRPNITIDFSSFLGDSE